MGQGAASPGAFSPLTRDDPTAFAPPPAFGPFRVLHQVGVGALGPVFRTYEPTRDRLVAVKVFRLDITPEQAHALAEQLLTATRAELFHPSIVEPIAAGVEGTVAYRAEEYVAAESLDVAMRHYAPAAIDKVLPFMSQLAAAVDFARMNGVGHGALHPRDIFVTPEEARATGFGVVEALEAVNLRAPVRRPYSAPERVAGGRWGTPADIFSLGAIAYELLTGRRPAGIGAAIGDLSGASVGEHTGNVHAVLVRAMEEDPSTRFPTAMAFASALEAASRGEAVAAARPVTPPAQTAVVLPSERGSHDVLPADVLPPEGGSHDERHLDTDLQDFMASGFSRKDHGFSRKDQAPSKTPPAAPPLIDDIKAEQEDDEAFFALTKEESDSARAPEPPRRRDLFEMEPIEDLPIAPPSERFANADFETDVLGEPRPPELLTSDPAPDFDVEREPDGPFDREADRFEPHIERDADVRSYVAPPRRSIDYVPDDSYDSADSHRPRTLSRMLLLMLGVLAGFGLGFAAGYSYRAGVLSGTTTETATTQADTKQPPPAPAAEAGKPYSEQAVTAPPQPPSEAPPIPPDAPAPATTAKGSASTPSTDPAPAADRGRLIVRSTPANAGVTIDGTWRGRTPLTLEKLRLRTYDVRVVQPGYAVEKQSVALTANAPARTLSFRLQRAGGAVSAPTEGSAPPAGGLAPPAGRSAKPAPPAPPESTRSGLPPATPEARGPGSLYVDSRPRGAAIFLDDRQVGVTPATIPDVTPGPHVIRLQLPDHRLWTANTQVLPGQQTRVTGSLERVR